MGNNASENIINAIHIIAKKYSEKQTKIYTGLVVGIDGNKYNVSVNGKTYLLPKYGDNVITLNQVVKVFIPQNNMSQAFVM